MKRLIVAAVVAAVAVASPRRAAAQDLFEIQVYPYETVEPNRTMVEFHTNFFASGTKTPPPGELANHHQVHFTTEITHGFTPFFELAGYIVTAAHVPDQGSKFAGARIRPGSDSRRRRSCRSESA